MPSIKRPLQEQLPTPEELARVFKKPSPSKASQPRTMAPLPSPQSDNDRELDAPIRHSVPPAMMPVVYPPYTFQDFFSDLPTVSDEEALQRKAQANQIMHRFPPPMQPIIPNEQVVADGGIIVPFIFPPVPPLQPDYHLNDTILKPSSKRGTIEPQAPQENELFSEPYGPQTAGDKRLGMENNTIWPLIPPLPFPPPNYMPYPLSAQKAPLTPHEVFEEWLEALEHLPRVDMVVASAAGSIVDIRSQSEALGVDVKMLDKWIKGRRQKDTEAKEASRSESESSDVEYEEYAAYARQVDTSETLDPYAEDKKDLLTVYSDLRNSYLTVVALDTAGVTRSPIRTYEWSSKDIDPSASENMPTTWVMKKDIASANGNSKPRRRLELIESRNHIERFAEENREQVYAARKKQLLNRLRSLQQTRISLDDNSISLEDTELKEYIQKRKNERDHELLRLKIYHNHEKLKAALLFYQTSNSTYKGLNRLVINKLRKLKQFLEHQQLVFSGILANGLDAEAFNLRSKESANLMSSFVEQDYSSDVKHIFRTATLNEDKGLPPKPDLEEVNISNFDKVFTSIEHSPQVHDFMPLATEEEFKLITGDAPLKMNAKDQLLKGKAARHQIFQSLLYDRITSGSDSNASDSAASGPKRRPGRRAAPKPVLGEEPSKERSEAALVAKIMKQFVGPAAANADELTEDLDLMNVETRWPVR